VSPLVALVLIVAIHDHPNLLAAVFAAVAIHLALRRL
jgi:hypothetical protein